MPTSNTGFPLREPYHNLPGKRYEFMKKYTIDEVQRLTNLSPASLKEFLTRHQAAVHLETVKHPDGREELVMGRECLERLLFIHRLQGSGKISNEAGNEMLCDGTTATAAAERETIPEWTGLLASLGGVAGKVERLQTLLDLLLTKYSHLMRDLALTRGENQRIRKDLEVLRERQIAMIRQGRDHAAEDEGKPAPESVN
jgi:hypothetical protein